MKKTLLAILAAMTAAGMSAQAPQPQAASFSSPQPQQVPDAAQWKYLGIGQWLDAWVLPHWSSEDTQIDYKYMPISVNVYESKTQPGMYKVQSPYVRPFPVAGANINIQDLELTVDATNPDFVYLPGQYSGFTMNPSFGTIGCIDSQEVYIGNMAGRYYDQVQSGSMSEQEVRGIVEGSSYEVDRLVDGVIDFNTPLYGSNTTTDLINSWFVGPGRLTLPDPNTPVDSRTWKALGKAKLYDGWICAGFVTSEGVDFDPITTPFDVDMEECEQFPGVYRLVSPWSSESFPFRDRNVMAGEEVYVEIDASDPTFVVIKPQYSGFGMRTDGKDQPMYVANYTGFLGGYGWDTKEKIFEQMGYDYLCDVLEDGSIWIYQPTWGYALSTCFFAQSQPSGGFYTSQIELPKTGVENIASAANTDAPVIYYDLNGRRCDASALQPGVYVRRQGSKVSKVAVK